MWHPALRLLKRFVYNNASPVGRMRCGYKKKLVGRGAHCLLNIQSFSYSDECIPEDEKKDNITDKQITQASNKRNNRTLSYTEMPVKASCKYEELVKFDEEYCQALDTMTYDLILHHMLTFSKRAGKDVHDFQFYKQALTKVTEALKENRLSTQNLIKLMQVVSIDKDQGSSTIKGLLHWLPPIEELTLSELSVVAEAIFRCGIKLNAERIYPFVELLNQCPKEILSKKWAIINICKVIRVSKYQEVWPGLKKLSDAIVHQQEQIDFLIAVNILILYGEKLINHMPTIKRLMHDIMKQISEFNMIQPFTIDWYDTSTKLYKVKYVVHLLWACSRVNYKLASNEKDTIELYIEQMFSVFLEYPVMLTDILLYLWILNTPFYKMVDTCVHKNILSKARSCLSGGTEINKFNLLLKCMVLDKRYERLQYVHNMFVKHKMHKQIEVAIMNLYRLVCEVAKELPIKRVKIEYPIYGLFIHGITCVPVDSIEGPAAKKRMKGIHLDLLTNSTTGKVIREPTGLLNMKMKMLKMFKYKSILVDDLLDSASMRLYISEELKEVLNQYFQQGTSKGTVLS